MLSQGPFACLNYQITTTRQATKHRRELEISKGDRQWRTVYKTLDDNGGHPISVELAIMRLISWS